VKTNANVQKSQAGHWYTKSGEAMHFVPCKSRDGNRPTNIADARKLGLFPSVTTILKTLNRPALNDWLIRQAVYAVVTAPTLPNESLDDKLVRVLEVEKQQDEESQKARDTGTAIHEALELALTGKEWDKKLEPYIRPVLNWRTTTGSVVWTERILVGPGYAGRSDLLLDNEDLDCLLLTDFKTAGKLPDKDSWPEARLQTAAYAHTLGNTNGRRILTGNVYISTKEPGQYRVFTQADWPSTYANGFLPLFQTWCWLNSFFPGGQP
jgi:hypothetical protein